MATRQDDPPVAVMPSPLTTVTESDDSVPSAPIRRPLRRPSDRYRREQPRQLRYRLATGIASAVSRVVSWLPDRVRDWIADRAGDLWIRLTPAYRANVIANLGQVLGPETSRPELEAMAKTTFRMSARNFGELLRVRYLSDAELA